MNFELILTIIFLLIACLYFYFKNAFDYCKKIGVPTVPTSFLFGNIKPVVFRQQSISDKVAETYRLIKPSGYPITAVYFFVHPVFVPISLDLIKNIFLKDFHHFDDRGIFYDEENDPVSAHLFSLYGDKWKTLRSKLTPAFTTGKIKFMFDLIQKNAKEMIDVLSEMTQINREVEIKDILARYTTDVIGNTAFGIECNSLRNPEAEFRVMGNRAFLQTKWDLIRNMIICASDKVAKVLRLSVFPKEVSKFFKKVLEETISYRENNNVMRKDFLQILIMLKNGQNLESNELNDQKITLNEALAQGFIFFLAGFETTSTSMGFAVFELALNEDIQEKARKEVFETLEKHNGEINYDFISELNYLDMVLAESMRKYPPAPAYCRKCTKDYQIPGTKTIIKKGMPLVIPTFALHRDPDYFPEPDVFNPERFNNTNKHNIKEFSYIPFGEGPRKCIGMKFATVQSKLALVVLLKSFKFKLSEKTILPLKMETKGITLAPANGVWIEMERI
nr:probable cytochrome P450 6a21 isoform X1 [Onthophagus taurus]XP_022901569.1 probable cytochrome P450 6a21 isoform X1 [Onthophagus taurus]